MISRLSIFALASLPLWSAQFAVLQSGFRLSFERAESVGHEIRLHRHGGDITIRAADVAEWLSEEDPPPAPVLPAPVAPAPVAPTPVAPTPLAPSPASPIPSAQSIPELIREAAAIHGLPEKFVRSVALAESALQPDAVSPKGALGVMQLMPTTARQLGVDPSEVRENIEGGTRLLRDLLVKYQNDPDQVRKALAAYNAGPGAVKKFNGVPPYRETRTYVDRVLRAYQDKTN